MRQPKPFFRKFTGTWYVQIGKKQINLGKDKEAAFRTYHELMLDRGQTETRFEKVAQLLDAYLDWVHANRAKATYDKAQHYLSLFARRLGPSFTIARLEGIHITHWIESRKDWSPSSQNDAASLVQRAFNWAVKRGYLPNSPVAHVEGKPSPTRREVVFSAAQWRELRALVPDQSFGDLLDFLWSTGCRPLEARTVAAQHIDIANAMIVFPPSEAKGDKHERVIFLPDDALAICNRLVAVQTSGPIFRNTRGRPWTKDSINCRFKRLRKKFGKPACAYAIRHSFATEGLKQGVDSLTLSQLMGHSDTSMLAKHYAHLARNPAYLRDTVRKMKSS